MQFPISIIAPHSNINKNMESYLEEIFSSYRPKLWMSVQFVRSNKTYQNIFKQYFELYSKELIDFLMNKMKQGEVIAGCLFYDLLKQNGNPVPIEIVIIEEHQGDDQFRHFREEKSKFRKENGLYMMDTGAVDSMFRADRISKSEWFAYLSFPENATIASKFNNLNM